MGQYVGLDVSQNVTVGAVIDETGAVCWQGSCASTPLGIEGFVRDHAADCAVVVFETGPLAVWHWHSLKARGLPVVCVHARHAHAAISMQLNKTDRNDALALAQMARAGWYKPVDIEFRFASNTANADGPNPCRADAYDPLFSDPGRAQDVRQGTAAR